MTTTGQSIDRLIKLRAKRLKAERAIEEGKREERAITDSLVEDLCAQKLDKASGKLGTFSFSITAVGRVEDWDAFYGYIKRTGAFELLERRVAQVPLRERLADGKPAPKGLVIESVVKTSLTARRD